MRLIVNTNRIIAALVKNSFSRRLITSDKLELITPEFAKTEIEVHKSEVLKKAAISNIEFARLSSLLFQKIHVVEDPVVGIESARAKEIMDKIDPDDSPFISLALLFKNDGIWTDDPHFKKQKTVPIFTTKELVKIIGLSTL